ncbi:MAG: HD domain-containing protein [Candidatus Paralactobacillus gallistercoris]|uniref:HD domain-containing protein n=1 Tax=Candidatus Paralactobacillus gallistercoris TaxID=2838724 RepID=A0A948TJR8_9LACO|nr:HD domain-containing protein [Candidatus Paralactobacillus gallistercoris]
MNEELIDSAQMLAKRYLKDDTSGHDYFHAERVAQLAVKLYQQDHYSIITAQKEALTVMGYLHDIVDDKLTKKTKQRLQIITEILRLHQLDTMEINDIIYTITHMSYAQNLKQHYQLSLLGQYVQDSDRLDALGALGVARAFAYGGRHHRKIYDPAIKPVMIAGESARAYHRRKTTTINHFYEKLLQLPQQMNTNAGKILAQRRGAYMQQFLDEFINEWYSMY